jgi:rod shape-determining protein MreD
VINALTVLLAAAAVIVDLSFAPGAAVAGARPSLTVVLVILLAALRPGGQALVFAPAAGLLLGLLGNEPLGTSLLAFVPLVLAGGIVQAMPRERRLPATLALVVLGSLVYAGVRSVLARLLGAPAPLEPAALPVYGLAALLNLGPALLLYPLVALAGGAHTVRRTPRRV